MENYEPKKKPSEGDEEQLAMVYSPSQGWQELYGAEEALSHGTLFRRLFKPLGGGNDRE